MSSSIKSISLSTNSDIVLIDELATPFLLIPTGIPANYFRNNYVFKIASGGRLYFESLAQKLSFGEFKLLTNTLNPFIEYESYTYNGTLTQLSTTNWYVGIPNYSDITKKDAIVAVSDSNRPTNFSFNSVIGYTYERNPLDNFYEVNRYDGGFAPLFKELSAFKSRQSFLINSISDLESGNTRFNLELPDLLKILNFNHIKIADTKILDLESNEEYEPRYEIIDEIAIGRSEYDLLGSNWDFGFHYKYLNKSSKNPVSGTLRIEEDSSFVSKLINLRDEIELENYITQTVDTLINIDLSGVEIAYAELDNSIEGYINVGNAITSFLISDGIENKFNQYLINSVNYIGNNIDIREYVKKYISLNILKLYTISEVELYSREVRDTSTSTGSPNTIEFEFLNDQQRNNLGYKVNRNLEINKTDQLILRFKFNRNLNSGLLISPKLKIKLI